MRLLVDTNLFIDYAYQYSAAKRHALRIVSFDADFDRTTEGRLLPTDVL
jgi:predicted nucleic acid-binding protein